MLTKPRFRYLVLNVGGIPLWTMVTASAGAGQQRGPERQRRGATAAACGAGARQCEAAAMGSGCSPGQRGRDGAAKDGDFMSFMRFSRHVLQKRDYRDFIRQDWDLTNKFLEGIERV